MPFSQTLADGSTITSTGLTLDQFGGLLQDVLANLLGIDIVTDPKAYSKIRIGWQQQPGFLKGEDCCVIELTEASGDYGKRRERTVSQQTSSTMRAVYKHSRIWSIHLVFYGPNAYQRSFLLKTALRFPNSHDALAAANVYLNPAIAAPTRAPELVDGYWWDRSDLQLTAYEGVEDTYTIGAIASAEVLLYDEDGLQADIQAQA